MRIILQRRKQVRWAYNSAVLEVKKDIPARTQCRFRQHDGAVFANEGGSQPVYKRTKPGTPYI